MSFPNFYAVDGYSDRVNILNICDEINNKIKAVKLFIYKEEVHTSVELFYPNENDIEKLIKRSIAVTQTALSRFYEEVGKSTDDGE